MSSNICVQHLSRITTFYSLLSYIGGVINTYMNSLRDTAILTEIYI